MKTIYTKMSKDRDPKFQQMTKIYLVEGERKVCKYSLSKEGQMHIENMYKNYTYFQSIRKNLLCPTEYKEMKLEFTYLTGKSLCNKLLDCVENENKEAFVALLYEFKNYVYNFGDRKELFQISDEYKLVFGDVIPQQTIGAKHLNIDLIFENLIDMDNKYITIDYEWIFDFVIPYEFVYYRAIYSFFVRYSKNVLGFIDIGTVYDLFGITDEDIKIFQQMDQNFLSYVYGKKYNYNLILSNYKKQAFDVKSKFRKNSLYTQLYYDLGEGFKSEFCLDKEIDVQDNDVIEIDYILPENVKAIRFDPSLSIISLYLYGIFVEDSNCSIITKNNITSNADVEINGYFEFHHNDSQIIISDLHDLKNIKIKFKFLSDNYDDIEHQNPLYSLIKYKNNDINNLENELEKNRKLLMIYKEIIKELRKR